MRTLFLCGAGLLALAIPHLASAQAGPSAHTTASRYDADRRLTGTIAPDPDGAGPLRFAAVRNTYDGAGRLIRVEQGELAAWQPETVQPKDWAGFTVLRTIDYGYDALDRKTGERVSGPDKIHSLTEYSYDRRGLLLCTAVRMNPAHFAAALAAPVDACQPRTPGAPGSADDHGPDRITRNEHDAAGQLVKVTEALGTAVQADEVTKSYSGTGKLLTLTDAEGNRTTYDYDGHDRLWRARFPVKTKGAGASAPVTGTDADFEEYSLDPNGNRLKLRKRGGQEIVYAYDALNRMTLKQLPGAEPDTAYMYDLRGLQLSASFIGSGEKVENGFDNAGRLTSTMTTMGGVSRTIASAHDANGNRISMAYPSGRVIAFDPDGLDRVSVVREAAGQTLVTYAYDPLGQRKSITRGSGASSFYGYNGAGRLVSLTEDTADNQYETAIGYGYNPAGQIVTRTGTSDAYAFNKPQLNGTVNYTANGLNQYASITGGAPAYDANGNMTSDGSLGFSYSSENMLTGSTFPAKPSGHTSMSLRYDPLLRLHETNGTAVNRYLYDGTDLVAEYNGAGTLLYEYIHGPGTDEPIVDTIYAGGQGYTFYFHPDERGSIHLASRFSGHTIAPNTLDEYGNMGWGNFGRFQFTGQAWLPDIFLYNYKARIYHPGAQGGGRFLQTDPTGYEDGPNWYTYAGNDPVNKADPNGRDARWIHDKATGEVTLRIPVYFTGSGANSTAINSIVGRAESVHIDNPLYRIDVVPMSVPGRGINTLDLSPGLNRTLCGSAGECINRLGGNKGHIDSSQPSSNDAAAHDIMHFAGIRDRYEEGPRDSSGNRTSKPAAGYTDANVMTSRSGNKMKSSQFEESRRNRTTIKCEKGDHGC